MNEMLNSVLCQFSLEMTKIIKNCCNSVNSGVSDLKEEMNNYKNANNISILNLQKQIADMQDKHNKIDAERQHKTTA